MSTPCHDAVVVRFILPVKDLRFAKSRLHMPNRAGIVTAMLLDTLEAVLAAKAGLVVLVSPDPAVAAIAQRYAVEFLSHNGSLNEAIAAAVTDDRCAGVLPDVPALRPDDVRLLVQADRGFVPDAAGTGTTMVIAERLVPVFGTGSAQAFESLGLPRLPAAPTARCDVDDAQGLAAATALGLGRHTLACLKGQGPVHSSRTGPW